MSDVPKTPVISIPATELNLRSGNVLRRVAIDREHVIIERNGYPLVAIIPIHDYHHYIEQDEKSE